MLNKIEQWIDQTNIEHKNKRMSCERFIDAFDGFYPISFLKQSYFVVVENLPMPDIPGLREIGLGDFVDMKFDGITYKNTYYIRPHVENNLSLHFHELVHVAQWGYLGSINFIQRYIGEIQEHGYVDAPLEKIAYELQNRFINKGGQIDVPSYISTKI